MANRICSVDGCEAKHYGRGFCKPHYRQDYHQRNAEHAHETNKAWREANREHDKQRQRDWYADHPEYFAEKYAANRDKIRESYRARRREHPAYDAEKNREWRKANPEAWARINRANQKRRREGGVIDRDVIIARDGMVCHICGEIIGSMAELNMDHVIPLSKGGPNTPENVKPSHAICNARKGVSIH